MCGGDASAWRGERRAGHGQVLNLKDGDFLPVPLTQVPGSVLDHLLTVLVNKRLVLAMCSGK